MSDGPILKDILYEHLINSNRNNGCLELQFKDTCKGYMEMLEIDIITWKQKTSHNNKLMKKSHNNM